MKILVTGGAGFIGSHIQQLLYESGHETVVLDSLRHGRKSKLGSGVQFIQCDITDPALQSIISEVRPEVVIHHAAHISVTGSIRDPLMDASVNILGTVNLLEACVHSGVRKIIYPSSASMFAEIHYLPIDEVHPASFRSPYGVSKHTAEHYLQVYRSLYGLEFTILRYANVYGPGQDSTGEGGVVSIFTENMLKGVTPVIFGDGSFTRDFVFVRDVAEANLTAVTKADGEIVNVSTGIETSISSLYQSLAQLTGFTGEPHFAPVRPGDIERSFMSTEKADQILQLKRTPLARGLEKTVQSFRNPSV